MSGRLVTAVLESALKPALKPVAVALASVARDDGSRLFPSVAHVAWLLGRSLRPVQEHLAALRTLGVLVVVRPASPHRATLYRFNVWALPSRAPWNALQPGLPFVRRDGMTIDPVPVDSPTAVGVLPAAPLETLPAAPLDEFSTGTNRRTHVGFEQGGVLISTPETLPAAPDPVSDPVRDPVRTEEPALRAKRSPHQTTFGPLDLSPDERRANARRFTEMVRAGFAKGTPRRRGRGG
jgi:hypothetical protein